jgi:hypothetical protein
MIQMGGYTEPSGKSSMESVWKRAGTFRKCLPGDRMNHLSIMHHVDHIVPHRTLIGPNTIAWLDAWKDGVLRARELVNPAASRGKVFVVVQKHYYKKKNRAVHEINKHLNSYQFGSDICHTCTMRPNPHRHPHTHAHIKVFYDHDFNDHDNTVQALTRNRGEIKQ